MPGKTFRAAAVIGSLALLAGVAGGVLWALTPLGIHLSELKFKTPNVFWKLFPSSPLLILTGLVGVYLRTSGRRGWIQNIGLVVVAFALLAVIAGGVGQFWLKLDDVYIMSAPAYRTFRIGLLALAAGSIVFGLASMLRGAIPVWISLPFTAGSVGVLFAVARDLGKAGAVLWIAYGVCWSWLGLGLLLDALISLWRERRRR